MYVTEKKNIMTNNETKLCLDKKNYIIGVYKLILVIFNIS